GASWTSPSASCSARPAIRARRSSRRRNAPRKARAKSTNTAAERRGGISDPSNAGGGGGGDGSRTRSSVAIGIMCRVQFLVEQHRDQIAALCVKYKVLRLELFGSAARGDADAAHSDFDFFVEFEDLGWQGSFKRYMGLKLDLEDLLERPVDLVEP